MPRAKSQLSKKTRNAKRMFDRRRGARLSQLSSFCFNNVTEPPEETAVVVSEAVCTRAEYLYDSQIDYENKDDSITKMDLVDERCNAKWSDKKNGMCCFREKYYSIYSRSINLRKLQLNINRTK